MMELLAEIVWDKQTLSIAGAFSVPLAVIIAGAWYKATKVRHETDLKRAMVDRGMSAEEIERVIAAAPKDE